MELLHKYFTGLTNLQIRRFSRLLPLYQFWNEKINVISRKDMGFFYEHHVLHSLSIARLISFKPGSKIMDVGTGGGFPGIPLAIMFPDTDFFLADSIGKKIKVVRTIVREIGLTNVIAEKIRAEHCSGQFDFIVSRAVAALPDFIPMVRHLIKPGQEHNLPNGILYLKGGDFERELQKTGLKSETYPLSEQFDEPFFTTKYVVHLY